MTSDTKINYLVLDGKLVPFEQAKIHILSASVKYGATAFEGIRAYWSDEQEQLYLFRCREHLERLLQSAWLMGMEGIDYTIDDMIHILVDLLKANDIHQDVHIRPSFFVVSRGQVPTRGPVSLGMAPVLMNRWSKKGFKLAISSWSRLEDNILSPRIKCAANYQNGRMALIQAEEDGYDGVLMLDNRGHVTEEPRGCFFMVRDGVPITPPVTSDILESITRETLIQLFQEEHRLVVQAREVDRTELYVANEVFLCGTGFEVTPVHQIDRFEIGRGLVGPITMAIRETYMATVRGKNNLHPEWRIPIYS